MNLQHEPITLSPVAFDELRSQLKERSKPTLTLWEDQQVTMEPVGNPVEGLIPCLLYFKNHRDLAAFIEYAKKQPAGDVMIVHRSPL